MKDHYIFFHRKKKEFKRVLHLQKQHQCPTTLQKFMLLSEEVVATSRFLLLVGIHKNYILNYHLIIPLSVAMPHPYLPYLSCVFLGLFSADV